MSAVPVERDPRGGLGRLVDAVRAGHERVTLTRGGEPVAVVVGFAEWESLVETLDILRTPGEAEAIDEGLEEIRHGRDTDGPTALAPYLGDTPRP